MSDSVERFYDDLAADYHHIYADWNAAIERQSSALDRLIRDQLKSDGGQLLDCSCGIGTIGLAQQGYHVAAFDISPVSVARSEAASRGLDIQFEVADLRSLQFDRHFDVVISCDNSLPHLLTRNDLNQALGSVRQVLSEDGLFVASIRDYDQLLIEKPQSMPPDLQGAKERQGVTFQIWEWSDESDIYLVRLFVLIRTPIGWEIREFRTRYRAIRRSELTLALETVGFTNVRWQMPEQSCYFQPIVTAKLGFPI